MLWCQDCELPHPQTSSQLSIFTASPGPIGVTQCWLRIKISLFLVSLSLLWSLSLWTDSRSQLSLTSQDVPGWKQRHCKNTRAAWVSLCAQHSQQWVLHITANSYHRTNITFPSSWLCPPPAALSPDVNTTQLLALLSPWLSLLTLLASGVNKDRVGMSDGPATDTSRLLRAMTPTEARLRAPDTRNILWQNIFYLYRPSFICGQT